MLRTSLSSWLLRSWFLAACVLGGLFLGGIAQFGSLPRALAYLRGHLVIVEVPRVDLGVLQPGQVREAAVTLVNLSRTTARVLGSSGSCECVVVDGHPLDLPPRGSRALHLRITPRAEPGSWRQQVEFRVDRVASPLRVTLQGTLAEVARVADSSASREVRP